MPRPRRRAPIGVESATTAGRRDAPDEAGPETDARITAVAAGVDLGAVAEALTARRDRILARWLAAAQRQPFHAERPSAAVTDHIPTLLDALVDLLRRNAERGEPATPPLEAPAVAHAAEAHAQTRFEQGHGPVAVVTEFRLLRQEVARALVEVAAEDVDPVDIVGGLAVISDGLDGAATVGLSALSERISTLREAFLATTLHDIRQPITLVEGSLLLVDRWLATPGSDIDRTRSAVADAVSATAELMSMVDTMSDASRVAVGALEPQPEPVSLEAVVAETIASLGAAAQQRIVVDSRVGRRQVGLWDPGLLRRLVANLIGNALKYSPDGSEVTVTLVEARGQRTRLAVADQGLGMSHEEIGQAFDRFVRADRVRDHGISGLGLGLYACQGIVEAHGGSIVIHSPGPGHGTTVTVELPLLDTTTIED